MSIETNELHEGSTMTKWRYYPSMIHTHTHTNPSKKTHLSTMMFHVKPLITHEPFTKSCSSTIISISPPKFGIKILLYYFGTYLDSWHIIISMIASYNPTKNITKQKNKDTIDCLFSNGASFLKEEKKRWAKKIAFSQVMITNVVL